MKYAKWQKRLFRLRRIKERIKETLTRFTVEKERQIENLDKKIFKLIMTHK
jgi:hypothetical protein